MKQRIVTGLILGLAGGGLLSGMLIPFFFESQSLWYKFGIEKAMLQWGKSAGLLAVGLMACQVLWVSRSAVLDRAVSLKRRFSVHRACGVVILVLAVIHPVLILWADRFALFPLERRYWPEFLGILVAVLVLVVAASSLWRDRLNISAKGWRRFHRFSTPVVTVLALVHAGAVSETFDFILPGIWLGIIALTFLALLAGIYIKRGAGK